MELQVRLSLLRKLGLLHLLALQVTCNRIQVVRVIILDQTGLRLVPFLTWDWALATALRVRRRQGLDLP